MSGVSSMHDSCSDIHARVPPIQRCSASSRRSLQVQHEAADLRTNEQAIAGACSLQRWMLDAPLIPQGDYFNSGMHEEYR